MNPSLTYATQLQSKPVAREAGRWWHWLGLGAVMLLAIGLHFYNLEQEGYGNLYYAATVKSMLTSWHNFFYASFDPGGFVTVDKPPLGLWTQCLSVLIFGFNGWALMFPQAIAGVLSVALLYGLVRRVFGPTAGLVAALVLAVTPVSIAANRNNTMDSQLVLTSLLAAWAVTLAAEKGKLRWLLLCAFLVGVGFNIKMLQAVMVLPAFYLLYLLAPIAWWKRLLHLALATVALAVVSLSWAVIVDLTPADQRPYIGSSTNNTVMELIVGHNGAARLGQLGKLIGLNVGGPRAGTPPVDGPQPGQLPTDNPQPGQPGPGQPPQGNRPSGAPSSQQQFGSPPPPPGGQPGGPQGGDRGPGQPPNDGPQSGGPLQNETGEAGLWRLFNEQLAGQASWLLPLALVSILVIAWQVKLRWPLTPQHLAVILWAGWVIPQAIFFSFAGLFHRYYLEMMAPGIAALVGAGVVALWNDYQQHRWRGWLLPLALAGSAAIEAGILADYPEWAAWLTPLIVSLGAIAAIGLIALRLFRNPPSVVRHLSSAIAAVGVLTLFIAPTVWAGVPVVSGGDAGLPYASPDLTQRPHRAGDIPDVGALVSYLETNRGGARYLAATLNANSAAPIILTTGEPVMALGGFSGSDSILSTDELAAIVAQGEVRFFLIPQVQQQPPDGGPGLNPNDSPLPNRNQANALTQWVSENCSVVEAALWQSGTNGPGGAPMMGPGGPAQLYDCGQ